MLVETIDLEKYFISLSQASQDFVSNLKLQKLLYYAQAWHLAYFNGKRFIDEDFQAWIHGPVIPNSYYRYKSYGWKPILLDDVGEDFYEEFKSDLSKDQQEVLKFVTNEYFGETAFRLELISHRELPWVETRGGIPEDQPSTKVISDDLMTSYYGQFIED